MLFTHFLDRGATYGADEQCMVDGDRSWTYREAQVFTYRVANTLRALGHGPGTHAAVLSTNSAVSFLCAFGFHRANVTWIPANPNSAFDDTRHVLGQFECTVLFFHSGYREMVDKLRAELPGLKLLVCLDQEIGDIPSLEQWLAGADATPLDLPSDREDLAVLMPTGGTTGRSKGVMLTQRVLYNFLAGYMVSFTYEAGERPVVMVAAPLTHAAGMMSLAALARGGSVVILPGADVGLMLDTIETHRVTEFFLPPTVVYRMLDHPGIEERDFSSVRYFAYAAAPMSLDKLKRALTVFGPCMAQFFGQSEAPAMCTWLAPQDHWVDGEIAPDEVLTSCGYPTPFIELKILDDAGHEVPSGEPGEVCIRGDMVTPGYYRDEQTTAVTLVGGWLHTGDVGWLDGGGRLHLVDRKKDMIISGGLNIYPQEIEQVIWGHPAVQDCAVIGIPDEDWGERVTAVLELNSGAQITEDEIIALCKDRLGSVKTPKRVDITGSLPRSSAGKVLKRELRDHYWTGLERKIH
ncbi:AMP-binding protein [Prauserella halophila]|uniref:AMP-binding protein n=1 Tax=Prauserella halophila TaxID=185641 RepID=A0ABN1WI81_9PSEU|nr:AMP-binding protein [Prauserella halophila]MCP2238174.1 Acyl-CoA synthetase (AMP-forming)/AMP-acid ligase II [Prauserella halophila]